MRVDYIVHYKAREVCRELGAPDYNDLTELELSIRATKDYHPPNSREWKDLGPVILNAISLKLASQPFRTPTPQTH